MAMNNNDTRDAQKGIQDDSGTTHSRAANVGPRRRDWLMSQFHACSSCGASTRPALFQALLFILDLGCDHPRIVRNDCASQTLIVNPTSATCHTASLFHIT